MRILLIVTLLASFTLLSSFTTENSSQENNNMVAIARKAIKQNCPNSQGNLQYNVRTVSACFADGFITEVTFYKKPQCPPNQYCIQVIQAVGTVTLGCDNSVISVNCGAPIAQ
jgi:hypothetical protein